MRNFLQDELPELFHELFTGFVHQLKYVLELLLAAIIRVGYLGVVVIHRMQEQAYLALMRFVCSKLHYILQVAPVHHIDSIKGIKIRLSELPRS